MLDMSDAFDDDTSTPATVFRPGEVTYVEGYPERDDPRRFRIAASIQPMGNAVKQNEWMQLPEGIRNEASCVITTPFPLQSGDVVESSSGKFKVLSLDLWQPLGGYTRAILGGMKS